MKIMKIRIIFLASLLLLTCTAYADTCPTVKAIKSNQLAGWKAYDSDDGKPLSTKRAADFTRSTSQFILAEWSKTSGSRHATIHCLYRDENGSDLEAYLSKENLVPEHNIAWYAVSGAMQCAAGGAHCQFAAIKNQPRLAKK